MISREGMAGKRISDSNGSGVGGEGGGAYILEVIPWFPFLQEFIMINEKSVAASADNFVAT